MKKLIEKWNGKAVEDDCTVMSKEAKSFVTQFRNALRKTLPNDYVISIKAGHYDLLGFVSHNGKYEYINFNIPRYGTPLNLYASDFMNGVLYRSATDDKDYHGGHNNYCSVADLPQALQACL